MLMLLPYIHSHPIALSLTSRFLDFTWRARGPRRRTAPSMRAAASSEQSVAEARGETRERRSYAGPRKWRHTCSRATHHCCHVYASGPD